MINEQYKKRLSKLAGITENNINDKPDPELKTKLLSLGGTSVAPVYEEDLHDLLSRGQVFSGKKSKVIKMRQSRCHANASEYWDTYSKKHGYDKVKIVTGWALSITDDMWRQHTWAYLPGDDLVIETTLKRKLYFGFILTTEEAHTFYMNNCHW